MYTAIVTKAKKEFSLSDSSYYMDIWFDILIDEKKVADRRLAFPVGTTEEAILKELKSYCRMYKNDHKTAKEAEKRSKENMEADKVLNNLKGKKA